MKNRFPGINKALAPVHALAHKGRLCILDTMYGTGVANTTELSMFFGTDQAEMSRQLGILASGGIISKDINGKYHPYKIDYRKLAKISRAVKNFVGK